jgi:hypothetical protein
VHKQSSRCERRNHASVRWILQRNPNLRRVLPWLILYYSMSMMILIQLDHRPKNNSGSNSGRRLGVVRAALFRRGWARRHARQPPWPSSPTAVCVRGRDVCAGGGNAKMQDRRRCISLLWFELPVYFERMVRAPCIFLQPGLFIHFFPFCEGSI